MKEDRAPASPDFIIHKIDWEGWPDALEWLVGLTFEDKELDQLIYDAYQTYLILEGYRRDIENLAEDLSNAERASKENNNS